MHQFFVYLHASTKPFMALKFIYISGSRGNTQRKMHAALNIHKPEWDAATNSFPNYKMFTCGSAASGATGQLGVVGFVKSLHIKIISTKKNVKIIKLIQTRCYDSVYRYMTYWCVKSIMHFLSFCY